MPFITRISLILFLLSGQISDAFLARDINECETNPCDKHGICTNTPGSFTCSCKKGYSGNGTKQGRRCVDEDSKFPVMRFSLDGLKHSVVEVSLADLQGDEDHAFRNIRLRVEDIQGMNFLTNFWV